MNSIINKVTLLLEKLLIVMMFAIVVTVSWQVFSRFVLSDPSSFTEELSRYLLIWIGILGASYAYKTKAHLGLDFFVSKMQGRQKRFTLIAIELVVIFFAVTVMVFGGFTLVNITLELKQTSAALGIQMGLVYSVIPLSGLLFILFAATNLGQLIQEGEK